MTEQRTPLLVVGGGIGGLTAALALGGAGVRVRVLERAPEFTEVGAGLQVAPNASRVLDRLGVLERLRRDAVLPREMVFMNAMTGTRVGSLDLGEKFRRAYGYEYLVMHRADLLAALVDACRADPLITLESGRTVVEVEDLDDTARVRCEDGAVLFAEGVIGADGLHSVVRGAVGAVNDVVSSQYVAYRGAVPIDHVTARADPDQVVVWAGPQMHLVQYPVRRAELYNQVAVFRSPRYSPDHQDWGTPEELDEHFVDAFPHVRKAVGRVLRDRRWELVDRDPEENWTRNRLTLLGDAAHPMLQFVAQGACQAIEDAACLARSVVDADGDIPRAFAAYQEERRPRTSRVQREARAFGEIIHLDGMGAVVRDAYLASLDPQDFTPVDWLYGHHSSVTSLMTEGTP
ncbi:FAD-dependent monooxygenase [Actinomadura sp. B10D3]|uniref:FAD-dependent monooxygenase n=1 Tax=Actinomadura sp. B10D3 TaxID=3153557 RepID=UPI00325EFBE2